VSSNALDSKQSQKDFVIVRSRTRVRRWQQYHHYDGVERTGTMFRRLYVYRIPAAMYAIAEADPDMEIVS